MITRDDMTEALSASGIEPGMTVFSHSNIAFFGRVEGASDMDGLTKLMLECFREVLGPNGTLVLPAFTYSFGSDQSEKIFDLQKSLTKTSALGNWLIKSGEGRRSADPMLSVVATGMNAKDLTSNIGDVCFGPDSIWARLHAADALICNLNFDSGSTFLHWVEREVGVPYRTDFPLSGTLVDGGNSRDLTVVYSGRDLDDPTAIPKFERYHQACIREGVSSVVSLGRGQIVSQRARAAKRFLTEQLAERPYMLTARTEA